MNARDDGLDGLLDRCGSFENIDKQMIADTVAKSLKAKHPTGRLLDLEDRWYASLADPDYSVYGDPVYIAEAWCCYWIYSRKYLKTIRSDCSFSNSRSVLDVLGDVNTLVDVGCGYGHTAATWTDLLPDATVFGTNVPDTLQMNVARQMGDEYGFEMRDGLFECDADVVFASEYFEHMLDPITHLRELVAAMNPKVILTANAFGQRAIGHFLEYRVGSITYHGKQMNKVFAFAMDRLGYSRVKSRMWNQRPALWARTGE